jgi:prevent-host-death family protein
MRTVNISDLKAQLSTHIQLVRVGEEVLVCDRNKPVARIVPVRLEDRPEQEQRLVARGVLTPPLKKRPKSTELGRLRVVQCNCYATAPF